MTSSGLATPPRAAPQRQIPVEPEPPIPRSAATRVRPSYERVLGWSVAVSILLHLLALLVSPTFIQTRFPPGGTLTSSSAPQGSFGMEAIVVIPSANAPEFPVQETPLDQPEPVFRAPTGESPTPTAGDGGAQATGDDSAAGVDQPVGSARDALRPGYRDPRLYVAPPPLRTEARTDHERYMEHLQTRIDAVNDSMAASARRESTTADWTLTDDSGNRWGVSSEGLHLGGVTIPRQLLPLPRASGDNQSLEAGRERERQREEIQRQEADRELERTRNERIEAIRERQRNQGSGGE